MGIFVRWSTRIKPLLTDANKAERTAFCEFDSLWDVVHLDEKWFNADKDRRKVYLVPGETPPRRTWKSKRFIPKVMFLAAVIRPRFDHDRGVNVNATVYRDYVINKVIPAIKAFFPSANKRVVLQHDNATPHASITDAELQAVSTDGWMFVLRRQPPNSPDLNALDLGFFGKVQSLQYKSMSRTVDDVIRTTLAAFEELSYEKLESVFLTFQW
ncbi:hypothetical protein H257_15009 [Aphanomyces astaci]|uniref:Tc1-like transposase DDE domain-containing protein n=1 Tax=Aphanomyces astaci TaxID=112090 RepID=W4FNY7_APHAT|nr:hypothetical protein H257_15009 [Aphanomyces astaci]ETV69180.1 hypothetical protein H257_15009 [Aphanomyces astaci]|eukprot:XP_009841282.1 hypothetical protein H257_15009 [Aphanomyces astaci]